MHVKREESGEGACLLPIVRGLWMPTSAKFSKYRCNFVNFGGKKICILNTVIQTAKSRLVQLPT